MWGRRTGRTFSDLYLDIAAESCPIDREHHGRDFRLNLRPTRGEEHHDGQSPLAQVLLVLQILVGGHQDLESSSFSLGDQVTVLKGAPGELIDGGYVVETEMAAEGDRSPLIKEDLHATRRL